MMPKVNPCKKCNTYPVIDSSMDIPTPKMIREGMYPIVYARYKCPSCGAAPSWGRSYSYCERGMKNNAELWNAMFGAERKEKPDGQKLSS